LWLKDSIADAAAGLDDSWNLVQGEKCNSKQTVLAIFNSFEGRGSKHWALT
jgi:hypothetical protein